MSLTKTGKNILNPLFIGGDPEAPPLAEPSPSPAHSVYKRRARIVCLVVLGIVFSLGLIVLIFYLITDIPKDADINIGKPRFTTFSLQPRFQRRGILFIPDGVDVDVNVVLPLNLTNPTSDATCTFNNQTADILFPHYETEIVAGIGKIEGTKLRPRETWREEVRGRAYDLENDVALELASCALDEFCKFGASGRVIGKCEYMSLQLKLVTDVSCIIGYRVDQSDIGVDQSFLEALSAITGGSDDDDDIDSTSTAVVSDDNLADVDWYAQHCIRNESAYYASERCENDVVHDCDYNLQVFWGGLRVF